MRPHVKTQLLRCECEDESHFPQGNEAVASTTVRPALIELVKYASRLEGHAYGIEFAARHIHAVKTPFGAFAVCPACTEVCLGKYSQDGENLLVSPHDRGTR